MTRGEHSVRLLQPAQDDLADVIAYVAADDPSAAHSLVDRLERALERLAGFPRSGHVPKEPLLARRGYRYLVIDNFLVFYTVDKKTVLVHRVIHGARDYRGLL